MSTQNDDLEFIVKKVIKEGDLQSLTFKKVFQSVEKIVGEDLSSKKQFLRDMVTRLLSEDGTEAENNNENTKKSDEVQDAPKSPENDDDKSNDSITEANSGSPEDVGLDGFSKKDIEMQRLMLEAFKSGSATIRSTRNGAKRKSNTKKTKTSKKRKTNDEEETENNNENGETGEQPPKKTPKKRNSGLAKPAILSESLATFLETDEPMPRTEVVKRLHAYIKEHNLQNPKDRRIILFDQKLQDVFKRKTTDFFKLNKLLSKHVIPIDEAI